MLQHLFDLCPVWVLDFYIKHTSLVLIPATLAGRSASVILSPDKIITCLFWCLRMQMLESIIPS
jgi:hypothetical protein